MGLVSGGFFAFQREFLDYLDDDPDLLVERKPLQNLAPTNSSSVFRHEGFWMGMDTYREFTALNTMWESGNPPWRVWIERRSNVGRAVDARAHPGAVSDLPEHHGQRGPSTLAIMGREVPLDVTEVPTGTDVLDWTVPREWNIRDAWIKDRAGNRVVDFRQCNLHVVSYSTPVHATMRRDELQPHLYSLPDQPDWVPYRTSYYNESWGFCLSENQRKALVDDEYEVCIDSDLSDGHLTYGECVVPGSSDREVLVSSHVCHPSLCQ